MLLITFSFILVLTVIMHYQFLSNMAVIFETKWSQSTKLVLIICGLFIAHIMEIIVYAMVYYHSDYMLDMGEAKKVFNNGQTLCISHLWPIVLLVPVSYHYHNH